MYYLKSGSLFWAFPSLTTAWGRVSRVPLTSIQCSSAITLLLSEAKAPSNPHPIATANPTQDQSFTRIFNSLSCCRMTSSECLGCQLSNQSSHLRSVVSLVSLSNHLRLTNPVLRQTGEDKNLLEALISKTLANARQRKRHSWSWFY